MLHNHFVVLTALNMSRQAPCQSKSDHAGGLRLGDIYAEEHEHKEVVEPTRLLGAFTTYEVPLTHSLPAACRLLCIAAAMPDGVAAALDS